MRCVTDQDMDIHFCGVNSFYYFRHNDVKSLFACYNIYTDNDITLLVHDQVVLFTSLIVLQLTLTYL